MSQGSIDQELGLIVSAGERISQSPSFRIGGHYRHQVFGGIFFDADQACRGDYRSGVGGGGDCAIHETRGAYQATVVGGVSD